MPQTRKILSLSHRNIALLLIAASAVLSYSAMVWISDRPEPRITTVESPQMPVQPLPPSGLDQFTALPGIPPSRK